MFAIAHRPDEVDCRDQHAKSEDRCACRREHIEHLKLRRVSVITARHAHKTGDKLGHEGQIKPNEDHESSEASPSFRIHPPRNLWPPVMQTTEVTHERSTDHDVVEMCDHKIGIT